MKTVDSKRQRTEFDFIKYFQIVKDLQERPVMPSLEIAAMLG